MCVFMFVLMFWCLTKGSGYHHVCRHCCWRWCSVPHPPPPPTPFLSHTTYDCWEDFTMENRTSPASFFVVVVVVVVLIMMKFLMISLMIVRCVLLRFTMEKNLLWRKVYIQYNYSYKVLCTYTKPYLYKYWGWGCGMNRELWLHSYYDNCFTIIRSNFRYWRWISPTSSITWILCVC